MHGCFDDVFQHRHVRPQIEMLEHHGQFGAHFLQLFLVTRTLATFCLFGLQYCAVQADFPAQGCSRS
jgi:hypothetical protein